MSDKLITFAVGGNGKRRDFDHSPATMFAKIQRDKTSTPFMV